MDARRTPLVERLERELQAIHERFVEHVAQRSLAARDVATCDAFVAEARSAMAVLDRIPPAARGPSLSRLARNVQHLITVYQHERDATAGYHEASPEVRVARGHAGGIRFSRSVLDRHLSRYAAGVRDLGLFAELRDRVELQIAELERLLAEHVPCASEVAIAHDALGRIRAAIEAEALAQAEGDASTRATRLVELAAAQAELHDVHFVGVSPVTRRPALLERILANLRRIEGEMRALPDGVRSPTALASVAERLAAYDRELTTLRRVRRETPFPELLATLARAADDLMGRYAREFAGRPRRAVDPAALARLCDAMCEIIGQMVPLANAHELADHLEKRRMTARWAIQLELEYQAVMQEQRRIANDPDPAAAVDA